MKILHVVHWPRSGIGILLRDLVKHRSADVEHVALCLAPGRPVTDQIRAAGGTVHEPHQAMSGRAAWMDLRRHLRFRDIDVIHSHSITPRVIAAAVGSEIPHVTTVHTAYLYFQASGLRNALKRGLECAAARRVTGPCVCVSADVVRSLPCAALSAKARVILNGVDISGVRSSAEVSVPVPESRDPLLVAVGRLDWEKGFDRLLEAVAAVRSEFPNIGLILCGDGVERTNLEARSRELGLSASVFFMGYVANPMPYLRIADAYVSSSLQEGFGLTIAEAMAIGRPVISTPAPGVGWLRAGETAVLASGFASQDIAAAIQTAFSDRVALERIANGGREFASANLDVRRMVVAYEDIYRDLAAQPARPT